MKLRGAKKEEFLKRMAAGRRKAKRGTANTGKMRTRAANTRRKIIGWTRKGVPIPTDALSKDWSRYSGEAPGTPPGIEVKTFFSKGKYLGPDADGIAPVFAKKKRSTAKKNAGPRSVRKSKKAMKKFLPGLQRKKRRNQEDMGGAAAMFESFHQRPPRRTVEYDLRIEYPDTFAELGKLKELRFDLDSANRDFPLVGFGACQVVSTPDGENIYFIGGDQKVDLEALDIASDKDLVELGPCTYIMYHAEKGFHDFEPIDYFHRFGEEDGIVPNLVYDRLNKTLMLVSGNYRVRAAGIEN